MTLEQILMTPLWGNNILQYLIFVGVVAASFAGAKIVYFLFSKIFLALTKKTKTQLDDLLVQALQGPVVLAVITAGIKFGLQFLTLVEETRVISIQVLGAIVILNVAWFVSRAINATLKNYVDPLANKKGRKHAETVYPLLKKLVRVLVWSIAAIVVLQHFKVEVTGLVAGLGIGGLAFALAAQDILSNLFGGAALLTDKPFVVGDRIKVAGQDGIAKKIGLRSTVIETFDGTHVVMPNKIIADSVMENVTREKMRRIKFTLGVEYSTSTAKLEKAKKILADIVKKNPSTDDESLVYFLSFGDSSLNLQLIYWISDLTKIFQAQDEVNFEIKKAFEKAKIEFAYPSQTVYVKK